MRFDLARLGLKLLPSPTNLFILCLLMIQLGILFLWIKPLRALLLPDAIGQVKIIAQTQFTGYPYWFDSIAYFSMITTPFWGAIVGKYIQKRVQR